MPTLETREFNQEDQISNDMDIVRKSYDNCRHKVDQLIEQLPSNEVCDLHAFMETQYRNVHKGKVG